MYGVLERKEQRSGDDHQERLMLSFDKMFGRERHSILGMVHDYWMRKRSNPYDLPSVGEFYPKASLLPETAQAISFIDVSADDPFNYVIRDHPNLTPGFLDLSDRRIGDSPSKMNVEACAKEYTLCISLRRPLYHEIRQSIREASRGYIRLMLPVVDETGAVVRLFYASRLT